MVPEAVPPAPVTEDAESIEKCRRLIDRKETAALRRFSLMRKGPRTTKQRSRSPFREEDGKALPVDDKAPPEMPSVQRQQFFQGGRNASTWQHPAGDEPPGMEATFLDMCSMSKCTLGGAPPSQGPGYNPPLKATPPLCGLVDQSTRPSFFWSTPRCCWV